MSPAIPAIIPMAYATKKNTTHWAVVKNAFQL
jgi:hypothetical protein